jgi:hypothetical protein
MYLPDDLAHEDVDAVLDKRCPIPLTPSERLLVADLHIQDPILDGWKHGRRISRSFGNGRP